MKQLSDVADYQFGNGSREEYIIVIADSKMDFKQQVDIQGFKDMALQSYSELDNREINLIKQSPVNGMPALVYQIKATVDKQKVVYFLALVEGQQNFYQILFWTLPSRWDNSLPMFDESLQSFQECTGHCET